MNHHHFKNINKILFLRIYLTLCLFVWLYMVVCNFGPTFTKTFTLGLESLAFWFCLFNLFSFPLDYFCCSHRNMLYNIPFWEKKYGFLYAPQLFREVFLVYRRGFWLCIEDFYHAVTWMSTLLLYIDNSVWHTHPHTPSMIVFCRHSWNSRKAREQQVKFQRIYNWLL